MVDDDKKNFRDVLNLAFSTYNKPRPEVEVLRLWWSKLEKYELVEVCKAFDQWFDTKTTVPTPAEIIDLCRHRVTIHAKHPTPLAIADQREHVQEVKKAAESIGANKRDPKAWAREIIANPKRYPEISLKFAKEALNAEVSIG